MTAAHVTGLGFWAPGLPCVAALAEADWEGTARAALAEAPLATPPCTLLPAKLARRASFFTRFMLEAAGQAATAAGVDPSAVPTVFATARGEMEMLTDLLAMGEGDGALSPIRFHNSVYNTASGYFSIAAGNRGFTTTVAAGDETLALALLEAFGLLAERGGQVLLVCGDQPVSLPFAKLEHDAPLAGALCLTASDPGTASLGQLSLPRRGPIGFKASPGASPFANNPAAVLVPFLRGIQGERAAAMALSGSATWWADWTPRRP